MLTQDEAHASAELYPERHPDSRASQPRACVRFFATGYRPGV